MNERGVTLIEMLMAIIISAIAFMALAMPFVAERSFSVRGQRQTEAQRDAQLATRAMARAVRQSSAYNGNGTFTVPCGTQQFTVANSQLRLVNSAGCGGQTLVLIDGGNSRVTNFAITLVTNRIVHVAITVTYQNQADEVLDTELFLRNAT